MLVACCDQDFGISTSRCSKTTSPRSLPMTAARSSHSTSSNGSTPGSVKKRGNVSPAAAAFFGAAASSVSTNRRTDAVHRSRPSAGRHRRPGRQRASFMFLLRSLRGSPGSNARPRPAAGSGRHAVVDSGEPCRLSREAGKFSLQRRSRYGRQICARPAGLSSSVTTRYCAFLLGQSQDVDACGKLCTGFRVFSPIRRVFETKDGRWEAVFQPPVVHRQGLRWDRVPSAGCERTR